MRHILAALLGVTFSFCSTLAAFCQPPADSPIQAAAFTRTVITVSLDGQTAEEAINQIVSQVSSGSPDRRWTWWRDGGVDPNKIVSLNLAGGSAAEAMTQLTGPLGWEAFPIPGILLVGRPEWIDRTLGTMVTSAKQQTIDLKLPQGTSSRATLSAILGQAENRRLDLDRSESSEAMGLQWLPHDVWPEIHFQQVDPWHAASLALSEFQMAARQGSLLARLRSRDESLPDGVEMIEDTDTSWRDTKFLMTYPTDESEAEVRRAVQAVDASGSFRSGRDPKTRKKSLRVHTNPAGHRAALAAQWNAAAAPAQIAAAGREATYDLKLLNKPANEVLQQFAGAAAKKLAIDEDAKLRSQAIVSLDATKQTLEQLAQSIADQANLHVVWGDQVVRVSLPKD
ncbi:hypothetical protein [Rhodopirellula bahusiensis]|uniref:hypothetical protein n=2 Tax=Rhodopirellula bahusiensis TaxID=2014065 RepID=UPI00326656BA